MEAIVAAPDDDAPRLVWADREGGERGELVVIQCRLARHDVTREERVRLAARETSLLENNTLAWAGVRHATFRRGFVETVRLEVDALQAMVEELFVRHPLLAGLGVTRLTEDVNTYIGPEPAVSWAEAERKLRDVLGRVPPGRLRSLDVSSEVRSTGDWSTSGSTHHFDAALLAVLRAAPTLRALHELVMVGTGVGPEHVPAIAELGLHRLHLGGHQLGGDGVVQLLREASTIARLTMWGGTPCLCGDALEILLAAPEIARLKELELLCHDLAPADVERIAGCAALSNLERLAVGYTDRVGATHLARSPHLPSLRELDLYAVQREVLALDQVPFSESVRARWLPSGTRVLSPSLIGGA